MNLPVSDMTGSDAAPFRVGILAVPGFALMSYSCTVEPLRAANLLARRRLYEVVHYGQGAARCSGSATVMAERGLDPGERPDLLLVIAGGDPFAFQDSGVLKWLTALDRAGVAIGGVSGGSVILARAGLMAGRRMTVHWEHAPALAERHADLLIERRLYVMDRDRVTCGGGTAPLDLMHALIAGHHGAGFARLVSDWFLHTDIRASAAPQRAGLAERIGSSSPRLLDAVGAMEDHVAEPLSLAQLALLSGVTPRQLNRLFQDRFAMSPMDYYRRLRLDVALGLLGGSSLSVGEVAAATGFASAAHFSRSFAARYGESPRGMRQHLAA